MAATPPDVGTSVAPILDTGLDALIAAFVDLAPWLIPAGLVLMVCNGAINAFSRGSADVMEFGVSSDGEEYFRKGNKVKFARELSSQQYYAARSQARYRSGRPVSGGGRRRRR